MNIQLKLGDCIKLMNEIEDNSIDLILCDLPFQKTKNKWDRIIPFEELWKMELLFYFVKVISTLI